MPVKSWYSFLTEFIIYLLIKKILHSNEISIHFLIKTHFQDKPPIFRTLPFSRDRKNTHSAVMCLCLKNNLRFHIFKYQPDLKPWISGQNSEFSTPQRLLFSFINRELSNLSSKFRKSSQESNFQPIHAGCCGNSHHDYRGSNLI